MGECVFCDIVAKQAPASVVYEDDSILGFMDLYPATIGHVIVIPKAHASNLAALPPRAEESIASAGRKIGAAIYKSLQCEGLNWVVADGEVAGQEIFHVHCISSLDTPTTPLASAILPVTRMRYLGIS